MSWIENKKSINYGRPMDLASHLNDKAAQGFKVLENEAIQGPVFRMVLEGPPGSIRARPGQFFSIRCGGGLFPLLRRPFSLHDEPVGENGRAVSILYRVIGPGTAWLSRCTPGNHLDVLGPLGNGFRLENLEHGIVLVARGIGIAPLYAVAQGFLVGRPEGRVTVIMGARTGDRIFYVDELRRMGDLHLYTDDGSLGFRGRAPELLMDLFEKGAIPAPSSVFACGPGPMLRELHEVSLKLPFKAQVALEEHMGCGFGACLSCAVPLKPEKAVRDAFWPKPACMKSEEGDRMMSLICKDGPVYDLQEVDWDQWLS